MKSGYNYIFETWKNRFKDENLKKLIKERLIKWRREPEIIRIEKTNKIG